MSFRANSGYGRTFVTTIIGRYLAKRILLTSFFVSAIGVGPVILVALMMQLPGNAIFSRLTLPALASITPMLMYQALPLMVSVAVVWCYRSFAAEGTWTTLFSAGYSPWSARATVLLAVVAATGAGYILSCYAAPLSAGHLHDVLFSLRHDLDPSLLRPGVFNGIDGGRQVIFFDRQVSDGEFADVFILENLPNNVERSYVAGRAAIVGNGAERRLILADGSTQIFDPDKNDVKVIRFQATSLPLALFGNPRSERPYALVDELGPIAFFEAREPPWGDPEWSGNWLREAVKRLGIPPLSLVHTFLGLELVGLWGTLGLRQRYPFLVVGCTLTAIHLAIVVVTEHVADMHLKWTLLALVGAEIAVAVGLLAVRLRDVEGVHRVLLNRLARSTQHLLIAFAKRLLVAPLGHLAFSQRGAADAVGVEDRR